MGMTIIYIPTTEEMKAEAQRKADELAGLNNSIRAGAGNFAGFLGELAVNELLEGELANTYDYDIRVRDVTIDVKTKECKSIPYPDYEASVADYNTTQACDWYAFARTPHEFDVVWFCGMMKKNEYYEGSRFMKQGWIDPSNGMRIRADCWNMRYTEMPIPRAIVGKARERGYKLWIEDEA